MPLTQLDNTAALIVVDLQKGVIGMSGAAHPISDIVSRSGALADAFRAKGLPVVLVNVVKMAPGRTDMPRPTFAFPPDFSEIAPELGPKPGDILISKEHWGAFIGTGLDETLKARGVTQVFVTGVATSIGVESTARSAADCGYNVVLVTDAMTDRDAENHRHSVEKMFPRMGETDTTENVLKLIS